MSSKRHPRSFAICRIALAFATHVALICLPADAADVINNHELVKRYEIAAGALNSVLTSFAQESGIAISFSSEQVENLKSGGLIGNYSLTNGFAQVLKGSGLRAQASEDGYVLVSASGTLELGATNITGQALGAVTEGTGSYTTGEVTIGKTAQTLRHTPQSVSVLSQQQLADQNVTDLTTALAQAPGIVVDYTDSERVDYYSRGFAIDAIQYDGATVVQNSGGGSYIQSDTAVIDHMEVLRGATGMLRGAGNPSGTVNIVRKRPTYEHHASGSYTAGSWDHQRFVADVSGPISSDGAVRGRVIAVHDDKDSFQDSRMERKNVLYAVLAADLNDRTTLTGGIEYTHLDATGSWGGLPADFDGSPLKFSRSTYLGTSWSRWNRSNLQSFGELQYAFDNDWKVKMTATHTDFDLDNKGFKQVFNSRASTTNPYLMNVQVTEGDGGGSDQSSYSLAADGPFSFMGRDQQLLVGMERVDNSSYALARGSIRNYVRGIDVRNWNSKTSVSEPNVSITYASGHH
ncbi:TonB-dependent receptor, partial [Pseudomonas sp. MAFF 301449]